MITTIIFRAYFQSIKIVGSNSQKGFPKTFNLRSINCGLKTLNMRMRIRNLKSIESWNNQILTLNGASYPISIVWSHQPRLPLAPRLKINCQGLAYETSWVLHGYKCLRGPIMLNLGRWEMIKLRVSEIMQLYHQETRQVTVMKQIQSVICTEKNHSN